ncbi:MAG TPA: hypothetical protein VLM37_05775 [Fibrobacteraceae bacterium]|nr:hypothetical protein [Fibrobacteraceae bacterium]
MQYRFTYNGGTCERSKIITDPRLKEVSCAEACANYLADTSSINAFEFFDYSTEELQNDAQATSFRACVAASGFPYSNFDE